MTKGSLKIAEETDLIIKKVCKKRQLTGTSNRDDMERRFYVNEFLEIIVNKSQTLSYTALSLSRSDV